MNETHSSDPVKRAEEITAAARTVLRGIQMDIVHEFLKDGKRHGTTVEALYESFRAILAGEAMTIEDALQIGASEWYK